MRYIHLQLAYLGSDDTCILDAPVVDYAVILADCAAICEG
jgi:hypothetical protein